MGAPAWFVICRPHTTLPRAPSCSDPLECGPLTRQEPANGGPHDAAGRRVRIERREVVDALEHDQFAPDRRRPARPQRSAARARAARSHRRCRARRSPEFRWAAAPSARRARSVRVRFPACRPENRGPESPPISATPSADVCSRSSAPATGTAPISGGETPKQSSSRWDCFAASHAAMWPPAECPVTTMRARSSGWSRAIALRACRAAVTSCRVAG